MALLRVLAVVERRMFAVNQVWDGDPPQVWDAAARRPGRLNDSRQREAYLAALGRLGR